jgi:hypothetical protein
MWKTSRRVADETPSERNEKEAQKRYDALTAYLDSHDFAGVQWDPRGPREPAEDIEEHVCIICGEAGRRRVDGRYGHQRPTDHPYAD